MASAEDLYAPFWTHVDDLRKTLLKILVIIAAGVFVCFFSYSSIISFFTEPLNNTASNRALHEERIEHIKLYNSSSTSQIYRLPKEAITPSQLSLGVAEIAPGVYQLAPNTFFIYSKRVPSSELILLSPLEGMMSALKASLWIGGVATSPIWMFVFLQFLKPALRSEEKRLIWPFIVVSVGFIAAGFCFAYLITIPLANTYFKAFNDPLGSNMWSLGNYLDYTLFLMLANGLAFELCALGIFAIHLKIVSADDMAGKRRIAIVGAFILGALLTPPDVLTQVMLAIPLIALYEGLIIYARLIRSRDGN